MQYRVLIIPGISTNENGVLDLSAEIDRIIALSSDSLQVDVIQEDTELGIVEHLSIGDNSYDAIHMLGHATSTHFHLSETESLSADRVRRLCIDAGARLVFINSCDTGQMGQYVVNNGVAVAICYSSPVIDNDAIINAMRFYSTLAKSSDPFEDGLKEAYNAADPGDGSLMWLTNGEFVKQIISPIMARLDQMGVEHKQSFSSFNQVIGATKNVVQDIDARLSSQIARLTSNTKHTRYALISLIAIVLISSFALGWLISSVRTSSAHAFATATVTEPVPPTWVLTPTWTPKVPPKNTHGATPQKPTKMPTPTRNGTIPSINTNTPSPTVTLTRVPPLPSEPTRLPTPSRTAAITPKSTSTREPTETATQRPAPTNTATVRPTLTRTPTASPESTRTTPPTQTSTTWPTVHVPPLVTSTPTLTAFEKAVNAAVEATIAAGGCSCQ